MKTLKLVFKIISAVCLFFLVVSYLIMFFSCQGTSYYTALSSILYTFLALFVGFALTFIDNKLPHLLGLAFEGIGYILLLAIFPVLGQTSNTAASTSAFIFYVVAFFGFIAAIIVDVIAISKTNKPTKTTGEDAAMQQLMKWKQLQEKNIITEEEFEAKKKEIFVKMVEEE